MDDSLAQKAISQALKGEWQKAVATNKLILSDEPENTEAMNRLSRAYSEVGDFEKAKKVAQKVLKINPYDSIATKSLQKWGNLKKGTTYVSKPVNPDLFLEEPGKTKIVPLLHIGDYVKVIAKLDSGDEVVIDNHSHRISVLTLDGKYVGRLPDDLSAKLKKYTSLGNVYSAYIKSVDIKEVKVFLREVKRCDKLKDTPSFPAEKIDYVSFTPPDLVHKNKPDLNSEDSED
jgi:tetratricopeptide (TPR) repeat protein